MKIKKIETKDKAKFYIVFTGACVYNDKGEFLVQKRSQKEVHAKGMIAYPGGKVEVIGQTSGKVLEDNVKREVLEETGVVIDDLEFLNSHSFVRDDGANVIAVIFLAKYKSGEARVLEPEEADEVMWMKFEDMKDDMNGDKVLVYWVFKEAWEKIKTNFI